MIALGPFVLRRRIAQGGMGEIWSGQHRATRTPVAMKFLVHEGAKQARFRLAFRNEIRAVAGLDHRHIARVYDHGEVQAKEAEAFDGTIQAGAPWLAMELVTEGTLHGLRGRLGWVEVRHIALCLLDALAHAHARGVIHRDLKPSNVLVRWGDADLPRVTLTDFGLAQAFEETAAGDEGHFFGGTPSYMAPEQFDGRWRDYGPWTDLYGLGCLLWAMVWGKPPFGTKGNYAEKRQRHLRDPVPSVEAPFPVPEGLLTWLRRLLEKDPAKRYRRASDAAWALQQLGPVDSDAVVPTEITETMHPPSAVDTLVLEPMLDGVSPNQADTMSLAPSDRGEVGLALHSDHTVVPPMPTQWQQDIDRDPTAPIAAGLGMLGLRTIPMIDRVDERTVLWDSLRRVVETGSAQAVVMTGPAGGGKSRLAEWLCGRAHEVGAATVLVAEHSPIPGPGQGLGPMVSRFLRCQGLTREEILTRVEGIFRVAGVVHPDEWQAITELILPASDGAGIRFRSSNERYVTLRRLLGGLCLERPVVLWLDDVQWGSDALGFVLYMLMRSAHRPLPVLLVLTGTDDALVERRDEAKLLAELTERSDVTAVEVGPLPDVYRRDLIQHIVRLEPELAHKVEERVGGIPQFAVQLVTDWVERDLLVAGERGYRLRDGADVRLPDDVRALWAGRVSRLLSRRSAAEGRALELAAVLGSEVDTDEWRRVCERATKQGHGREADPSDGLLEVLLDQRFARCGPEGPGLGWSFAHAMLRESLVVRAREFDRFSELHAACALVLQDQVVDAGPLDWRLAERLGRHLASAGDFTRAAMPLLEAADSRAVCGDYAIADALLDLRDEALRQASIREDDECWGLGWLARQRVQIGYGNYAEGAVWLEKMEESAARWEWPLVQARAMCLRAEVQRLAGEYDSAFSTLMEADVAARKRGDRRLMGDVRYRVSRVLTEHGDLIGGERWGTQALADFEHVGDDVGAARAWQNLGQITTETGRHEQADTQLQEAERRFERVGDRWGMASSINSQGDVARYRGQLTSAADLYRRARGLFRAIGSASWIFPHYNLALVHLARREFGDARLIMEGALPAFTEQGNRPAQTDVLIGLAACAASERTWLLFDDHMDEVAGALRATASADEDTARLLSTAGDVAVTQGEANRAIQAYRLARGQWRILGREAEVQHLNEFIAQLKPRDG